MKQSQRIVSRRQRRRTGIARKAQLAVSLAGLVLLFGCRPAPAPEPTADRDSLRLTRSGEVVGFTGSYGSHVWLGLPYAAPPVGQLRWRAPQPPATWTGTHEALRAGSRCVQYASPMAGDSVKPGTPTGNEDCLFLNIYAPSFAPAEVPRGDSLLPVMVWIHGGGNTIGEAAFYDGGNLAASERLVVITLNYRLGPFGWLRHSALRDESTDAKDASGNFGLLDIVQALEWIRQNVSTFGGDPGNVTLFGESAGGSNVLALLTAPPAQGLFHRAIAQSGGLRRSEPRDAENAAVKNSSDEILQRLLVADGNAGTTNAAETAAYLRDKTAFEVLTACEPELATGMIDMPLVFADGDVVRERDPLVELADPARPKHVPVLLGTTRDEMKLFLFGDPRWVRKFFWILPRLRDEHLYNLTSEYVSKMWKAIGADEPAAALAKVQPENVYVYRFDWDEEPTVLGADLSIMLGAAHALEIPFVFGHFDLGKNANVIFTEDNEPARRQLSARMMSYWAEFAYHGSPVRGRRGDQAEWEPWGDGRFLVLDTEGGGGLRMSSESVTQSSVLEAIDDDPRLPTQSDKCAIFRELALSETGLDADSYADAGRKGCREHPL